MSHDTDITGHTIASTLFEKDKQTLVEIDNLLGQEDRVDFINRIAHVYWSLKRVHSQLKDEDEYRLPSWYLLWKCANDMTGCLQLLRLGYYWLVFSLLRGVIEGIALAFSISRNSDLHERFMRNESIIGNALKLYEKYYPGIRKIREDLHGWTHPSMRNLASVFGSGNGKLIIGAGYLPEKDDKYLLTFGILSGQTRLLETVTYLTFPDIVYLGSVTVYLDGHLLSGTVKAHETISWLESLHDHSRLDLRIVRESSIEIRRPPSPAKAERTVPKVYGTVHFVESGDEYSEVTRMMSSESLSTVDGRRRAMVLATAARLSGSIYITDDQDILSMAGPILNSVDLTVCTLDEARLLVSKRVI